MARGKCENGLYRLKQGHKVFLSSLQSSKLRASHELWHNRQGHVSFDIISLLNKNGALSVTSLFPKLHVCSSCQLSKNKKLPFKLNTKRASQVLDLVHCDLWGPAPVVSVEAYRYYFVFVDDFSGFTWFYPLKLK